MATLTEDQRALIRLYLNDPQGATEVIGDDVLDQLWDEFAEINTVVAKGWRIKAAKVSDWYMVNLDGGFLNRDQVFAHCIKMAEFYESVSTGGASGNLVNVGLVGPNAVDDSSSSEF